MTGTRKQKICLVAASPFTVRVFLTQHVDSLARVYDVTVICNTTESDVPLSLAAGSRLLSVRIERNIKPWSDVVALLRLCCIFRRERFDLVHSVSPKGGMLAQLAAWLMRVPHRIHTFTGQVWATKTGPSRWLLKFLDRLYASLATHVLIDSASQKEFLSAQRVVSADKGHVLGNGSISGVDVQRFTPNFPVRADIRRRFNVADNALLFLYLGRLKRDKGVIDLAAAFADHAKRHAASRLLFVGPDEEGLAGEIARVCADVRDRLAIVAFTPCPEQFLAAGDVLCLPSYREGFGSVIIEAAACGIPAIASRIYGVTDAVVDGQTGLLHEPGNPQAIVQLLDRLADDDALRKTMGVAARERALRSFSQEALTGALLQYYRTVLAS